MSVKGNNGRGIKRWLKTCSRSGALLRSKSALGLLLLGCLALIFVFSEFSHVGRGTQSSPLHNAQVLDMQPVKERLQARELKAQEEVINSMNLEPNQVLIPNINPEKEQVPSAGSLYDDPSNSTLSDSLNIKNVLPLPVRSRRRKGASRVTGLRKAASLAWKSGRKAWRELETLSDEAGFLPPVQKRTDAACPKSIFLEKEELELAGHSMKLPCGLTIGSSITVVGMPRYPHIEFQPTIGHIGDASVEVSQFVMELVGPKHFDKEPTRILHINPRLKGDWSDKPVIELNSFYNGQWGNSQRCDGSRSQYQETVEGLLKCEKWSYANEQDNEPSWWLTRLIGRTEKQELNWQYPFAQNRSFILTVRAGLEGYHMSVDGRHITSFPFSTGLLEEMTASTHVRGDVDLQAFIATSLPSTPPKTLNEQLFEDWKLWRAPKPKRGPIDLFIGVLSASNHFAERMAVRQTWFQGDPIQSGRVIARFFVALHADKDINLQMKMEAEYYGDMVILPFLDHYDLVVLKTVAICEYGVRNVSTKYIMKSDDDTFVRVDAVLNELKSVSQTENLYLGNMNMFHRPLRTGKWAVTFEEWPDEVYPTYANGPGYIISHKIASFILSQNRRRMLELFKMEDVSMGLWVQQFHHRSGSVQYVHSWNFYQAGCEDGYITAHYQLPGQMLCMWKKLQNGEVACCNTNT